jgi:hypothetical protein
MIQLITWYHTGDKNLDKYLKFATSLCNGNMHGTTHATVANALHHLQRHDNNILTASCRLYASHGFAVTPDSDEEEQLSCNRINAKSREWLLNVFNVLRKPVVDENVLEEMEKIMSSCPSSENESKEMEVLKTIVGRLHVWKHACIEVKIRKCTIAELQALLNTALDMNCDLKEQREILQRIDLFGIAKDQLLDAMSERQKGRKMPKIELEKVMNNCVVIVLSLKNALKYSQYIYNQIAQSITGHCSVFQCIFCPRRGSEADSIRR